MRTNPPAPQPQRIDSWRTAETNAAAWMRHWGYLDAHVTPEGNDGGVDVRSATAIAQVKREATDIGVEALQRLVGARLLQDHLGLLFFSGSGYTRKAQAYAEAVGMMLFVYEVDGTMLAASSHARDLVEAARDQGAAPPPDATRRRPETRAPSRSLRPSPATALTRPVTEFPEVVRLIRAGKRDLAVDAYAAAADVKQRQANAIVSAAWAAVTMMPPGRRGRT